MKTNKILGFFLVGLMVATISCASAPKVEYPPGTNAQEVTSELSNDIEAAQKRQMDVLAPDAFAKAKEHFKKAKEIQAKDNFKNEKALEELGIARAYLNQAQKTQNMAAPLLREVADARQAALRAGAAKNHEKEINNLDDDFADLSEKIEKGKMEVDLKKKASLQKEYLDLELAVINEERLSETRTLMKKAKDINAPRFAPKSWANAESKLGNAEAVISTDRHDEAAINKAVIEARDAARKTYEVANIARNAKSRTNEDVALDIYGKESAISDLSQEVTDVRREASASSKEEAAKLRMSEQESMKKLSAKDRELIKKEQDLAQTEQQRMDLEAESRFNQSLMEAQKQFKPEDAMVYRQGNNLVIRLKSVKFPSGGADLPMHALPVLGQTKQLIKELNAQKVVVEGHTDAIGTAEVNMRVSQQRADTIAKYLSSDDTIDPDTIETRGMGDQQPITTNKTRTGRAENRRVDIVITPTVIE